MAVVKACQAVLPDVDSNHIKKFTAMAANESKMFETKKVLVSADGTVIPDHATLVTYIGRKNQIELPHPLTEIAAVGFLRDLVAGLKEMPLPQSPVSPVRPRAPRAPRAPRGSVPTPPDTPPPPAQEVPAAPDTPPPPAPEVPAAPDTPPPPPPAPAVPGFPPVPGA